MLSIESPAPEQLAGAIREKLGTEAQVMNGSIRLERPEAHRFVPTLIESFSGQISAVTVGRPTLEDVFIQLTGHRFWDEDAAGGSEGRSGR